MSSEVEKVFLKFGLLDEDGREHPDPVPVAPPVGHNPQPSLAEKIRAMVQSEQLRMAAVAAGAETFDEADDFDVPDDDDFDPQSPWENDFDPPVAELRKREEAEKASETPVESKEGIPDGEVPSDDRLPPGAGPEA